MSSPSIIMSRKVLWHLNKDPFDKSERDSYNDSAARDFFINNPKAAQFQYNFKKLGKVNPLVMISCLAPSKETVEIVHKAFPSAIESAMNKYGWTPLFASIKWAGTPPDAILYLAREFPKAISMAALDKWTPIHLACSNNLQLNVVERLLDIANSPNVLLTKNNMDWTPLHLAISYDAPADVVQLLVERCPQALEVRNNLGKTPLDLALDAGSQRVVAILEQAANMPGGISASTKVTISAENSVSKGQLT